MFEREFQYYPQHSGAKIRAGKVVEIKSFGLQPQFIMRLSGAPIRPPRQPGNALQQITAGEIAEPDQEFKLLLGTHGIIWESLAEYTGQSIGPCNSIGQQGIRPDARLARKPGRNN